MRNDIFERKEDIMKWIKENKPKRFICKELSCKSDTLNKYLLKLNIIYSGNQGLKGIKISNNRKESMYYINNNIMINTYHLKNKLIDDGIKERKCEKCNNTSWNNVEIPLELHHIDCNRYNNNLNNLMILCPNCHSQIHNMKKYENKKTTRTITHKYCSCGKEIKRRSTNCVDCYNKLKILSSKNIRPQYEQLVSEIEELGYSGTGRKYNVSDNTIRKWVKK